MRVHAMAPINKKFRAVDALKHSTSSSSCLSPPSSPSVSSPPSVIVRNDCQRLETNGPYSSDSEQVDPRIILLTQCEKRSPVEVDSGVSQDLPIDATIGAKIDANFDTRNILASDSASNDSIVTSTLTSDNHDATNSNSLRLNDNNQVATLFSPISPPSPFQHHSQEPNSARRRNHSQHRQKHSEQQQHRLHHHHHHHHHELHSESSHNPEPHLHHQIHNNLHLHPQHLNIQNHMKDHHHHTSNVAPNPHCIIPSPSNSPFDPSTQTHAHQFTFPFSPTSSAQSLPPSPASVITENVGHSKDSFSSEPVYSDSNGIRTRADNSNSEPFPYEKSTKNSKRSTKSPPSLVPNENHSHRHVSFKMDNVSPTPSKSSTNSEVHRSSSSKGTVDKESEEYRLRRERNNIAVRKSRSKSKVKFIQTIDRMNQLEEENNKLHARIDEMSREVTILRLLVSRYHREDPRRLEHLEHLLAIEMSQEITMLDIGNNGSQVRNYDNSRSNINSFYKER